MDNFKIIYRILNALEKAMDCPEFDPVLISAKHLGISDERWESIIEMLCDDKYIKGVSIKEYIDGSKDINVNSIKITLKGLEYLRENSIMRKICAAAKGIVEIAKP